MATKTSTAGTHHRRSILILITAAMLINYMDRAALAVAMPFITQDFHLTSVEKGLVYSSFFVSYAVFNFVGGLSADRWGPKKVFIWAMTFWSAMCGLTAGAISFWTLLAVRTLFGVGEGPISTTVNKVITNWFPVNERARAVGISQAGSPLGGALAGPVVGFLALTFGWRASFVVIAFVGFTWAVIWKMAATDSPRNNSRVDETELALITAEADAEAQTVAEVAGEATSVWRVVFQPAVLAIALSLFCYNYILFFFMTWFPDYLVDAQGVSLRDMSLFTAIPWVVGAIGYVLGGYLIDFVYRSTGRLLFSRKLVLVSGLASSAVCVGLTANASTATSAISLMTVALGALMIAGPAFWTLLQGTVDSEHIGAAGGLMHGLSNIAGIIAPTVTGVIVAGNRYSGAFVTAAALGIVGAIIVLAFVRQRARTPRLDAAPTTVR